MLLSGPCTTMSSVTLLQDNASSGLGDFGEGPNYKNVYVADTTTDSIYTAISLLDKVIGDLDKISKLPANWDSYGSPKISENIIFAAKKFLYNLEYVSIDAPRVVPISGGGIQFEWLYGDRELELEFLESENIGYLKVLNDEPIEENQFYINDFNAGQRLIQWLKGY